MTHDGKGREASGRAGGRVIRVSDEAKRLLGSLSAPDGEVLRIERSVRRSFDGSSVEVVGGNLSVVPPSSPTTAPATSLASHSGARNVRGSARAREGGRSA